MAPKTVAPLRMKLAREAAYARAGKTYYRWRLNLPAAAIAQLGWRDGDDLDVEPRGDGLLLKRSKDQPKKGGS